MNEKVIECTFAIVGGGIAGVSCAEGLDFLAPHERTVLVTASPLIKAVTNIIPLGKSLMQFDVKEKSTASIEEMHSSVHVINDLVTGVNITEKSIETQDGKIIKYKKLCLCNGARPNVIATDNKFVIGIRDTESVVQFSEKIKHARRIVVVGNGGIATEIVHEVKDVEIVWVIKDKHISATFVDPGAAEFFLDKLNKDESSKNNSGSSSMKRMKYSIADGKVIKCGAALGPDWHDNFDITGALFKSGKVHVKYQCEVTRISNDSRETDSESTEEWPVHVELTNGEIIGCDMIVSATGVVPNSDLAGLENVKRAEDNGLVVDWRLQTSEEDVYAAGDVCSAGWDLAEHWFQMRLWTQAHQMGCYAAKSMVSSLKTEDFYQDFCFELFTHVTKFFGYKVILLGLYNGQKLNEDYEILLRMTKGKEYIKLILKNGKMQGAVLIGETDLEEMCENLILNQLDVDSVKEDLLNPNIDIEDYFD